MQPFYENKQQEIIVNQNKNLCFPAHFHQEIELVLVLDGALTITVEGHCQTLTKNMIAIVFPHCVHSYETSHASYSLLYIINYNLISDFETIFSNYIPDSPFITVPKPELLLYLLNARQLHKSDELQQNFLFTANWYMIFALLLQQVTIKMRTFPDEVPLVHQIITYILEHIHEPLSLKIISQNVNCSEYTVSKIFNRQIGISLPNYLEKIRISNAKKLLETSSQSIMEIAYNSGFDNTRSFNRSFLKLEKMTPRDYRKAKSQC